ncbi:MAG: hypothetical protein A2Y53_05975 [Chloroflexi bacterium RBG_16_47_49]|nr:MAG: hypothetical protein A2Y53_05975 [Chloroflexi bacterium RBG_16_47_49]
MNFAFQFDEYLLKRQVLALTGVLRIYNSQGQLVLFCQQKIFKLKEDIRVYSDETKTNELLNIHARQILDFSAYYEVLDSQYSTKIGGLRRKGFSSMIQDEWELFDGQDISLGILKEDSLTQALLRRMLLGSLLPQNYDLYFSNERVADYKQRFNPFRYELDLDFKMDDEHKLDRRLGIAAAILLATIEGHQHK